MNASGKVAAWSRAMASTARSAACQQRVQPKLRKCGPTHEHVSIGRGARTEQGEEEGEEKEEEKERREAGGHGMGRAAQHLPRL